MYKIRNDIVLISRIEKSIKSPSFLNKVFTENERLYCKKAENFAGLFAAKEAYFKALGTGIKLPLSDIEICHNDNGKPYFKGIDNCDLSISHDGDYAIATVIMW